MAFADAMGLQKPAAPGLDWAAMVHRSATADHLPAGMIVDLMQACAAVNDRPDLGAAFAAWGDITGYGPLSRLPDQCESVAEIVEAGIRFMHLENGALASDIQDEGEEIALRSLIMIESREGSAQFAESILMLTVRVVRRILGPLWTPLRVEFAHARPADLKAHRRLFRCRLQFGAERHAVILTRRDLHRPVRLGDPGERRTIEAQLADLDRLSTRTVGDLAQRSVAAGLGSGEATLDRVAASLGLEPRTLQRRLASEDLSFTAVLDAVRRREALDYLRGTPRPALTDLAARLGYADASAASRFLRLRLGLGVRSQRQGWRACHKGEETAGGRQNPRSAPT